MQFRGINVRLNYFTLAAVMATAWSMLFAVAGAHATDTDVNAVVCNPQTAGSSIDVGEPKSDSVVNQPVTTFRGTVSDATHVDVEVDGKYDSTFTVAPGQTSFTVDVRLSLGTHTVTLTANDICQIRNDSDSVIITYERDAGSSNGGETPTEAGGGAVVGANGSPGSNGGLSQLPFIQPIKDFFVDVGRKAGFDSAFRRNGYSQGLIQSIVLFAALAILIAAEIAARRLVNQYPRLKKIKGMSEAASLRTVAWILRLMAFIVIILLMML